MLTSEIFSAWRNLGTLSLIEVLVLNNEGFGGNGRKQAVGGSI